MATEGAARGFAPAVMVDRAAESARWNSCAPGFHRNQESATPVSLRAAPGNSQSPRPAVDSAHTEPPAGTACPDSRRDEREWQFPGRTGARIHWQFPHAFV